MVGAAGIEPATLGLEIRCSIRLSYAPPGSGNCNYNKGFRPVSRMGYDPVKCLHASVSHSLCTAASRTGAPAGRFGGQLDCHLNAVQWLTKDAADV